MGGKVNSVASNVPLPLLLAILGPTGSGKSALAVELGLRFSGEIVSCDSVAVYRNFEIGTAKPNAAQRCAVPHHLLDVADADQPFTAGEYARQARLAIAGISKRGTLPIVVGGTGLYLRALLDGLFPSAGRSDDLRTRLRSRAAKRGSQYLHRLLERLDPEASARIHANDTSKLIRAIEVCVSEGVRMTDLWHERGRDPLQGFRILRIGLSPPRDALYARINTRAQKMFDDGLVEETNLLRQRYQNPSAIAPLQSLGYKQALQLLRGEASLEQSIAAAQQGHRNYAKRQMTWFRREPGVIWLQGFGDDPQIVQSATNLVSERQNNSPTP
jgi:tRNA dimethylallyltransferase